MSESKTNAVTVEIYRKRYTFACEGEEEAEHIRAAAALVDEKMRHIQEEQHPASALQTAILAALNLVDELFRLRSDFDAAEVDIANRASRLTASLGRLLDDTASSELAADRRLNEPVSPIPAASPSSDTRS